MSDTESEHEAEHAAPEPGALVGGLNKPLACWGWVLKIGADPLVLPDPAEDSRLEAFLKMHLKEYSFQLELGKELKHYHYQGWARLKHKSRPAAEKKAWATGGFPGLLLEPAHHVNIKEYVNKEDTRVRGPWSTEITKAAMPVYIPLCSREVETNPRPWETSILATLGVRDDRGINVLVDETGGLGKSAFVGYCAVTKRAGCVPPCLGFKEVSGWVCSSPARDSYMIDVPRQMKWKTMLEFWTGVEDLKNGHCFDWRNHAQERWFDRPTIWCFTNSMPERCAMSPDKWRVWHVVDQKLVVYGDGLPPLPVPKVRTAAQKRKELEPSLSDAIRAAFAPRSSIE